MLEDKYQMDEDMIELLNSMGWSLRDDGPIGRAVMKAASVDTDTSPIVAFVILKQRYGKLCRLLEFSPDKGIKIAGINEEV